MNLSKTLTAISKNLNVRYSFKGRPLSYEEVFSDLGLLPGLAKRADQVAVLCFGYGIGATFEDDEKGLLGNRVKFDEYTPHTVRLLVITDVICELSKASPTPGLTVLDELQYD